MTAPTLPPAPLISAMEIGEQSATKPLGRFGCQVIRRPVSEGRRQAEMDAAFGEVGR